MKTKREIKPEERPICSCGKPMKLVYSVGYYYDDVYWECYNAKCPVDVYELNPDERVKPIWF